MKKESKPDSAAQARIHAAFKAYEKRQNARLAREGRKITAALKAAHAGFSLAITRDAGAQVKRYQKSRAGVLRAYRKALEAADTKIKSMRVTDQFEKTLREVTAEFAPLVRRLYQEHGQLLPSAAKLAGIFSLAKARDAHIVSGEFGGCTLHDPDALRRLERDGKSRASGRVAPALRLRRRGRIIFRGNFQAGNFPQEITQASGLGVNTQIARVVGGQAQANTNASAGPLFGSATALAAVGVTIPGAATSAQANLQFHVSRDIGAWGAADVAWATGFAFLAVMDDQGSFDGWEQPFPIALSPLIGFIRSDDWPTGNQISFSTNLVLAPNATAVGVMAGVKTWANSGGLGFAYGAGFASGFQLDIVTRGLAPFPGHH